MLVLDDEDGLRWGTDLTPVRSGVSGVARKRERKRTAIDRVRPVGGRINEEPCSVTLPRPPA